MSARPAQDIPAKATVMTITPTLAEDWLENRNLQANRRLSEHIAGKYAREIRDGRWMVTHQGIAFDHDGFLIDGQHRLRAVILAARNVDMFVVPDCDPATFTVLDGGFKRTAAHLISAPHPQVVSSAARFLHIVADDQRRAGGAVYESGLTTAAIVELVERWPELAALSPVAESCYKATKITRAPHLAVLAQAARTHHANRIEEWSDGLRSGASMESTDPRLALRNRWLRDGRFLNAAAGRAVTYRLIVRAWNAFVLGRPLARILAVEDNPAPGVTGR